jgi:hypothetical protein
VHLIVDGYNVMHALPLGSEWPGRTFQDRRHHVLDRLSAYVAGRPHRVTVVFDGARGGDEMGGADRRGAIEVLYSPRGTEADELILRMLESAPRPEAILLVTSDKSLVGRARSAGASTARADELVRRLSPPAPASVPDAATIFEERVKGFRPVHRRRSAPRSSSPLHLW